MEQSFDEYVRSNVMSIGKDQEFLKLTNRWVMESIKHKYALNFSWLGRPIIQVPQDIYAIQEMIWTVKPDLVVETGIAHGGSLVLSASLLALLDFCKAAQEGRSLDPRASGRRVLGVDIEIRPHNREAIAKHPMACMIETVEGSSISPEVIQKVTSRAGRFNRVMVFLDSNHTHDHVLAELEAYAPLVSVGSYCVVWDTGIEDLPKGFTKDRPWDKGNNPKTAAIEYLRRLKDEGRTGADGAPLRFEVDKMLEHKIAITASADGFLKRTA